MVLSTINTGKGVHKLKDSSGNEFNLYITSNYTIGGNSVIIVNESATGDGGIVYNNGRLQEEIPINGTLMAVDITTVNNNKNYLMKLKDLGEVVEFIGPYKFVNRTNKYFIKSLKFTVTEGDDKTLPFSMVLSEYRTANVNQIAINAVNFELSESLINIYNERTGNV